MKRCTEEFEHAMSISGCRILSDHHNRGIVSAVHARAQSKFAKLSGDASRQVPWLPWITKEAGLFKKHGSMSSALYSGGRRLGACPARFDFRRGGPAIVSSIRGSDGHDRRHRNTLPFNRHRQSIKAYKQLTGTSRRKPL